MFDTLPDPLKPAYYIYLKDSINAIREKAIADKRVEILHRLDKIDGIRLFEEKKYGMAVPILVKVLADKKYNNDFDSLRIMYCLKNSYLKIKSISKAVEIHKQLSVFEKRKKKYNRWYFYPTLSIIYYELKIYPEAIKQNRTEFAELFPKGEADFINFHNNQGIFFYKSGGYDSALFHFHAAKKFADKLYTNSTSPSDQFVIGLVEGNIGQVYKLLGKYQEAIPLLKKDIYLSMKSHNEDNAAISHNELAECYIALNLFPLAEKHLDSSKNILNNIQDISAYLSNLKDYGLLYEKSGRLKESITFYKKYILENDSISAFEKQKEVVSQQMALQLDEKESIIRHKQYIIDKEAEDLKNQGIFRNILSIGIIVILVIMLFVYLLYKRTQKQYQMLTFKNKEIRHQHAKIQKSLHDKEMLVREVHHRVKNNLQIVSSLLNLQLSKTESEDVKSALMEAHQRIVSMALVHQQLYRNKELTVIPVKEYFNNLLGEIEHMFSSLNSEILVKTNIMDVNLDLDRAIPLGLIINEAVSNAFKHAFSGKNGIIEVSFISQDSRYELLIKDNGKGFPEDFDSENSTTFGIEIIKILSEQINGNLVLKNDKGAVYRLTF